MTKQYKIMSYEISGIKCDTDWCGWRDDNAKVEDYQSWLNKPCPKCGQNLLTEKDFTAVLNAMLAVRKINRWSNKWLPEFLLRILTSKKNLHEYELDGNGKLKKIK